MTCQLVLPMIQKLWELLQCRHLACEVRSQFIFKAPASAKPSHVDAALEVSRLCDRGAGESAVDHGGLGGV